MTYASAHAPAEAGMALEEVDTPALVVELDVMEANLTEMARRAAEAGVRLRPHSKTHKCAEISLRQMALGAVGVCCQKVSEAEAQVEHGVSNVLISNQVVGGRKIARLVDLAARARVGVCVDHPENVDELGRAAAAAKVALNVLVEIDVGASRCGVAPGAPAVALAERVASHPSLAFEGLQAYQGRAQHLRTVAEREAAICRAVELVTETRRALSSAGLPVETIAGAGTGTYELEAGSGVYNELQPGSYVFMDADYARNLGLDGGPVTTFEHSLFVYATVMSIPSDETAIVDAGLKAFSVDSGLPVPRPSDGGEYVGASDEHGKLSLAGTNRRYRLGEKVLLVPGHCDPTVNLYDWLVAVRGGTVESVWPVVGRGAVY